MTVLRFGQFLFPWNPEKLEIQQKNSYIPQLYPDGKQAHELQRKGLRRVRCQGSFLGTTPDEVLEQWTQFLAQGEDFNPQLLVLPNGFYFYAYLSSYEMHLEEAGTLLPYVVEFVEAKA